MSPFGARSATRGLSASLANTLTVKPCGTVGMLPFGRASTRGPLPALLVANGGGMSVSLIWWMRPGWLSSQEPWRSLGVAARIGAAAVTVPCRLAR